MAKNIYKIGKELFITNDETIKEGDWYYLPKENKVAKCHKRLKLSSVTPEWTQKIILTTDPKLIDDGVQAIDDEFLEWFVKNPSCQYGGYIDIPWDKIITLKEEPICWDCQGNISKEGICFCNREEPKYPIGGYAPGNYYCTCISCNVQFQGDKRACQCKSCAIKTTKEEPKQETTLEETTLEETTLEEAAEHDWIYNEYGFEPGYNPKRCINGAIQKPKFINGFVKGAKWQQNQDSNRYSEKEVLELLIKSEEFTSKYSSRTDLTTWFKQHKK